MATGVWRCWSDVKAVKEPKAVDERHAQVEDDRVGVG